MEKRAPQHNKGDTKHAVIIDAGSSGSRAHVFSWPDPNPKKKRDAKAIPKVKQKGDSKKILPGVSKFAGVSKKKLWDKHLEKLVKHAEESIPFQEHYKTPIFFLATAGVRLLPAKDQESLLGDVCHLLQDKTRFYLPECKTHVNAIDGETEGLYGWLALNYLLDDEVFSSKTHAKSYGFMDMGGASAQVAFAPNETEIERHKDDLFQVNIRTTDGKLKDWKVFVSTWLGFGANEARNRFSEQLVSKDPKPGVPSTTYYDPCLPKGSTKSYEGTSHNSTIQFSGRGDFLECLNGMYPLLQKGLPCKDDPCLFNGVHVPAIDYNVNRFVGVSEYWYTANDVFKMGGKYDFLRFSAKVKQFCERPWDELRKDSDYKHIQDDVLQTACFKASWIINILHEGFGVPMQVEKSKKRGEPQSLMLHAAPENVTFTREEVDHLVKRTDIHNFLDPFQSAVKVRGQDLSWTLGRAALYASSQVGPKSPGDPPVGFFTVGANEFIPGGELSTSKVPSSLQLPTRVSGAGSLGTIVVIAALVVVAIIVSLWHPGLSKSQVHFAYTNMKGRIGRAVGRGVSKLPFVWPRWWPPARRTESDGDEEVAQRLLEEGDNRVALRQMPRFELGESTPRLSASMSNMASSEATTSSMVDINSLAPSRVSSRLGFRDSKDAAPVSFALGDDVAATNGAPGDRNKTLRRAQSNQVLGSNKY